MIAHIPYAPLLITKIGKDSVVRVNDTISAVHEVIDQVESLDTLIIVSAKSKRLTDSFLINNAGTLEGDFSQFNFDQTLKFTNDLPLVGEIMSQAERLAIPMSLTESPETNYNIELDAGQLTPLHFINETNPHLNIILIHPSELSLDEHFLLGKAIALASQNSSHRVGLLTTGHLAHTLNENSPFGFDPESKIFDQQIIANLENKKLRETVDLDPSLIEKAKTSGLETLAVALGALSNQKDFTPEVKNYNDTFGVGYLVVDFKLKIPTPA